MHSFENSKLRKVEVCSFSLESCLAAERAGADRIELCASPFEGGTTPSMGLTLKVLQSVSLKVNAILRPRGGDFCYDDLEYEVIKSDIEAFKKAGVHGLVLGILLPDGQVDVTRTKELVELAAPLPVTFHRAFDFVKDPVQALEDVIATGCKLILTSGCQDKAPDGAELIRQLVTQAAGRIEIMAGSGVNAANAQALLDTGVDALHLSGKVSRDSRMMYRKEGIALGGVPSVPEYDVSYTDWERVQAVVKQVHAPTNEGRK
ncbi:copper homeostasis protein CutC [Siphonobacter sp. SORGH_AS_0500]|uniref:copper homeostasis protein CutC n=1 Tax=Siphonobacter sp. SORGH_AS_0500 TaxID=1864824 RepID=UPI000CC812FF|nr:copper homeostasis protein CutC [Siphonobacter sp. SORGH_AS_0500]PKK36846.1 copper homeostasis protein CutC [Siphonobacter sp. SORGH_AS_0500]